MPELKSAYLGELKIAVTGTYMLGDGALGRRRIDLLGAGTFDGPRRGAKILPGGMDLLLGGSDGAMRPDVRLPPELDDGQPLLIIYRGGSARPCGYHGPHRRRRADAAREPLAAHGACLRDRLTQVRLAEQYRGRRRRPSRAGVRRLRRLRGSLS